LGEDATLRLKPPTCKYRQQAGFFGPLQQGDVARPSSTPNPDFSVVAKAKQLSACAHHAAHRGLPG